MGKNRIMTLYDINSPIFEEHSNYQSYGEEYQTVKNYLLLLRSNYSDQKEIADKFFYSNSNQIFIQNNLNLIAQNLDEKDDVRIQATVMLKKLYNYANDYIKYNKHDEEEQEFDMKNSLGNHGENFLALPIGFNADKSNKIDNLELYDSLPYIDSHLTQDTRLKEEMNKLIIEQMTLMKKENPAIENFYFSKTKKEEIHSRFGKDFMHSDELIKQELDRVHKGKKLDVFKNKIQNVFEVPPPNKIHDDSTWRNLIEGINFSLLQINLKNFNLDLMIKYGPNMWKRFLKGLECLINQLENEKKSLENKIEEINQKRKFFQVKLKFNLID